MVSIGTQGETGHWASPLSPPVQLQLDLPPELLQASDDTLRRRVGAARRSPVAVSVDLFHRLFGLPRRRTPGLDGVSDELLDLRVELVLEEAHEFREAVALRDLTAMADALADLAYVVYGAAVTLGIDLDDVVAEVHESNMTKLGVDGRPILRKDGKVLKPPTYRAPDIKIVLDTQPPIPSRGRH